MISALSIIIIGAGHNGLVAANYLAMAGARVTLLERREFVGGACITEELFPGFRVSSCSYVCHILQGKVIDDLEIRKHGFEIHSLNPSRFHPFPDGHHILTWQDHERNVEEIRRIAPGDLDGYRKWTEFWKRASGILYRYFLTDPPTLAEVAGAVMGTPDEEVFERMLTGNMKDLVHEHFGSELLRASFIEAHDSGDVRAPGSIMAVAYIKCNQFTEPGNLGIPVGGMGGITQALEKAARARNVRIRTGVEVERISIQNEKATGVVLVGGERLEADVILSNADPKRTFLTLVDGTTLEPGFKDRIRRLKTEVSCLKFHCSLRELPDFSSYLGPNHDPQLLGYIRICPSVSYFENSWLEARGGAPSSHPIMAIQIPSVYDTTLTPPGKHVMSIWSLYAPVHLAEGTWDDAKRRVGEQLIEVIAQYAPNIREAIIDWELFTPLDLERRVYLTDGNIRHLDIIPGQMLAQRPNRELSGYRTPVAGLYLCGAGTHPGGEVTGAPGHNAARAVMRDFKIAHKTLLDPAPEHIA